MECYCSLRNVKDLLANANTPCERRFGEPLKEPIMPLGARVAYRPISSRDQLRLHQFGKKVLPSIFLGYALIAGRICERNILIADIEDLNNLDASEIYPWRINAKEVLINNTKG